ncbi:MAG: hypothetical protein IPK81_24810 [Rhodospirillales bacterium]|nr:MAG: hypothetical protein IPK81_24810 [Rhodospirillales bacterium]
MAESIPIALKRHRADIAAARGIFARLRLQYRLRQSALGCGAIGAAMLGCSARADDTIPERLAVLAAEFYSTAGQSVPIAGSLNWTYSIVSGGDLRRETLVKIKDRFASDARSLTQRYGITLRPSASPCDATILLGIGEGFRELTCPKIRLPSDPRADRVGAFPWSSFSARQILVDDGAKIEQTLMYISPNEAERECAQDNCAFLGSSRWAGFTLAFGVSGWGETIAKEVLPRLSNDQVTHFETLLGLRIVKGLAVHAADGHQLCRFLSATARCEPRK